MMSQSIQGRETADAYELDFVDDKTGKCEFTLKIPHALSEQWAETFARLRLEAAQAELEGGILYHVPKSVRSNILKLLASTDKLMKEFYALVEPMRDGLIGIVTTEIGIIDNCNAYWKAHIAKNKELTLKADQSIKSGISVLADLKKAYKRVGVTSYVELLEKRLQQLTGEVSKVVTLPEAHGHYVKLYSALEAEVKLCIKFQQDIPSWLDVESKTFAKMKRKIDEINDPNSYSPDSSQKEFKESEMQPSSPTRVSYSSESKEISPNISPNNSPSNSVNAQDKDNKDSPLLYPIYAENARLSSLPQAMLGNNSQALQQQKKQLAAQQQLQAGFNGLSLGSGN
jgi:hypothetical protein